MVVHTRASGDHRQELVVRRQELVAHIQGLEDHKEIGIVVEDHKPLV